MAAAAVELEAVHPNRPAPEYEDDELGRAQNEKRRQAICGIVVIVACLLLFSWVMIGILIGYRTETKAGFLKTVSVKGKCGDSDCFVVTNVLFYLKPEPESDQSYWSCRQFDFPSPIETTKQWLNSPGFFNARQMVCSTDEPMSVTTLLWIGIFISIGFIVLGFILTLVAAYKCSCSPRDL
jgi:ABC-type glycerol-3-phosphate transport system permease component